MLRLLVCVAAFLVTDVAQAQKYPAQPIQVLVANGPGSASDVGTRVVLSKMALSLGQPAVIINRPFREGELTRKLARDPLPGWAMELGCATWAQALLKFIVSHPAVTCAIPATTRVDHVRENLDAAQGPLPDTAMRARIAADVGKL